jgi:hypothetical protein
LFFTTDAEFLEERWRTPSETVNIDSVDNVRINEPIYAFVVFSGCKPSLAGKCNVSMSFRVLRPDGKVYADTPTMEVWQDEQARPGKSLALVDEEGLHNRTVVFTSILECAIFWPESDDA